MEITVRRAAAEDAPGLARLRWRWRIEERAEESEVDRQSFVDFFAAWTLDHLGRHLPFVAEADGQFAGMAWLALSERVPSPRAMDRRAGDVQSVYIVPELRGNGVGARLMEALLQHARDIELHYVTVHSAETAIGFYERLGFIHSEQWMEFPTARLR